MRRTLWLLSASLALAALAACKRSTPAADGARNGVFLFANSEEVADLDTHTSIDSNAGRILNALFEGLVVESADGQRVLPGASDHWTISPDGLAYTFHLRTNARWSNGAPVTADDFLFSFRRLFDPHLACEASSFGFPIVGAQDHAEGRNPDLNALGLAAPDPQTFVIRLRHPTPYFLAILASGSPFQPVYPPSVRKFDGVSKRGAAWTRPGNLISNGRYQLIAWQPDRVLVAQRNPYYWDDASTRLKELRIFPVEDLSTQEKGFRSGQFHVTAGFPPFKAAAYQSPNSGLTINPINSTAFLTFNVALPPYNDPRVRRALSLALDRDRIISAVMGQMAVPAFALVRPGTGGYAPPRQANYQFNPAQARALLQAAGYPGGQRFPTVPLLIVGTNSEALRFGEAIQSAWKNVLGVQAELHPTEPKVYLDAERNKQYSVMIDHWGCPWNDPTAMYQTAETGNPNNDSGWTNAAFDRAYRDSEQNPDPAARTKDFDVQEAILSEEVPYAPLFYNNRGHLVHPAVRGWQNCPDENINWAELSLAR